MSKRARSPLRRSKTRSASHTPFMPSGKWVLTFILCVSAVGWSGLAIVESAKETRTLYQQLGEVQRKQDQLLEEHSRLSLERGTLSSLQKIEEVALQQLDMEFPEAIQGIKP